MKIFKSIDANAKDVFAFLYICILSELEILKLFKISVKEEKCLFCSIDVLTFK